MFDDEDTPPPSTDGGSGGDGSSSSQSDPSNQAPSTDGDSSSSSDAPQPEAPPPPPPPPPPIPLGNDEVADALTKALRSQNVEVPDSGVGVSMSSGLYHVSLRLSATAKALPQIPADTSDLAPRSQEGALLFLMGSVQIVGDSTKVSLRIVVTETSQIVETASGTVNGSDADSVQLAAEKAISGLPTLSQ